MLALDLAEGYLTEDTVKRLTSLAKVLGISLITLLGAFLLLMNKEVRRPIVSKLKNIKVSNISSCCNDLFSIAIHFTA